MTPNLFRNASAWLEDQRHRHATSDVIYRRGPLSVCVKATIGRTEYEQDDGYGVVIRQETRDFLIRTIDLVLEGEVTLPELGDRIEETQCGVVYSYEVLPIGGSQQHWTYSDQFRQTLRIHTKLASQEHA